MNPSISLTCLCALALSLLTSPVHSETPHRPPPSKIEYHFPAYASAEGVEFYANQQEYDAAVADQHFAFEKWQTNSGDFRIVTYLYRPAEPTGSALPIVVFARGSATMGDAAPQLITMFHHLASSGFLVVAPQYRGSDGGQGKDEVGGADLEDLTSALDFAKSLPYADSSNIFLYGASRGGMMTYQAIRDGFPANAAAVFGAFTDLEIMNRSPYVQKLIPQTWPDYEQHKDAIIRRRSAKYWPEKLNVPLLIMNGTADQQVDPDQPLALAMQLQDLHKDYAVILFNNGNHFLSADRDARDSQAIAWFLRHVHR